LRSSRPRITTTRASSTCARSSCTAAIHPPSGVAGDWLPTATPWWSASSAVNCSPDPSTGASTPSADPPDCGRPAGSRASGRWVAADGTRARWSSRAAPFPNACVTVAVRLLWPRKRSCRHRRCERSQGRTRTSLPALGRPARRTCFRGGASISRATGCVEKRDSQAALTLRLPFCSSSRTISTAMLPASRPLDARWRSAARVHGGRAEKVQTSRLPAR
jgi:hypothetical protein